jgi:hypothetical protein
MCLSAEYATRRIAIPERIHLSQTFFNPPRSHPDRSRVLAAPLSLQTTDHSKSLHDY